MTRDAILAATAADLRATLGDALPQVRIERAVIGLFFIGVKVDTGHAGLCATPLKAIPEAVCCPSSAMAMPFPGKLAGRPAADLLDEALHGNPLRRAVGIAALNALAELAVARGAAAGWRTEIDAEAFDLAAIAPGEHVVLVGAFGPFIKALKKAGQPFTILEKDAATLRPDEMRFYRPAEDAPAVIGAADVVLMTGTTLVNGSIDGLIAALRPGARAALIGPTVPRWARAFFAAGFSVLGGVEVSDADGLLDLLAEGGSGYHFLGRGARKICLVPESAPIKATAVQ